MFSMEDCGVVGVSVRIISVLLCLSTALCTSPTDDYVHQWKGQCYYRNGTEDIRFLERYIYNQEEYAYFDSDVGIFIAKNELGKYQADYYNSQKEVLEQKRAEVERVCKHNYQLYTPYTIDRKSKPEVKIVNTKAVRLEHENILTCYVDKFFPPMITVTWLRNGIEEREQVISTELLQNGDWTFQIHVMLETTAKHGDIFTCRVEHSSLQEPISEQWELTTPESARNKMVTGIVGFVLGTVFIIVGLYIYCRNKKTLTQYVAAHDGGLRG
ncbi:rano class II histocompatibility antigen, A beta chain-like [Rhinophrynus dorsalis]